MPEVRTSNSFVRLSDVRSSLQRDHPYVVVQTAHGPMEADTLPVCWQVDIAPEGSSAGPGFVISGLQLSPFNAPPPQLPEHSIHNTPSLPFQCPPAPLNIPSTTHLFTQCLIYLVRTCMCRCMCKCTCTCVLAKHTHVSSTSPRMGAHPGIHRTGRFLYFCVFELIRNWTRHQCMSGVHVSWAPKS